MIPVVVFQNPAVNAVVADPGTEVLYKILLNTSTVPLEPVQNKAAVLKVVAEPEVFRKTVLLKIRAGKAGMPVMDTSIPAAETMEGAAVLMLFGPLMFAIRLFHIV